MIAASQAARPWRHDLLALVERHAPYLRKRVNAGDTVQRAGEPFEFLHVVKFGACKSVSLAADGRERVVGLHFKGDWIGFDNIARECCVTDLYATDTGEIWILRYEALTQAAAIVPELMRALHFSMSCQLAQERDRQLALASFPADARVADFVRLLAESQAARDLRWDQISLRMTRAEIGGYLGLTLETVSRALGRLARSGLIGIELKEQRHVKVPSIPALVEFIQKTLRQRDARIVQ